MSRTHITGNYYHLYNRGVDKRIVFESHEDHLRFLTTIAFKLRCNRSGELLVRVLAYCLMPNHYHLLVQELIPNGISRFMHRVGTAYTMWFNKKHGRSGSLFEGRYCFKQITSERHLSIVFHYIHLNPVAHSQPEDLINHDKILRKLDAYPWSSHREYAQIGPDLLISKNDAGRVFQSKKEYLESMKDGVDHLLANNNLDKVEPWVGST